jgi:hypothetical protein
MSKTDLNVHLPTESDGVPALSKAVEWALLGQTKEAKLQLVLVMLRKFGGGCDEEDSKPALMVTSSAARIGSHSDQEVVQEQATTLGEIPYGWIRTKLEPDC